MAVFSSPKSAGNGHARTTKTRSSPPASRTPSPPPVRDVFEFAEELPDGAMTPPSTHSRRAQRGPHRGVVSSSKTLCRGAFSCSRPCCAGALASAPPLQELTFNKLLTPATSPGVASSAGVAGVPGVVGNAPQLGSIAAPPGLPPPPGLPLPAGPVQPHELNELQSQLQLMLQLDQHPQQPVRQMQLAQPMQSMVSQQVWNAQGPGQEVSEGSMGHPHRCAAPCRYIKRKGGCKDGAQCPNCHLCFWRRGAETQPDSSPLPAQPLTSAGTKGHPFTCAKPCKYVRRKDGCRDGADCLNCHECSWQRAKVDSTDEAQRLQNTGHSTASFFGEEGIALQGLIESLLSKRGSSSTADN